MNEIGKQKEILNIIVNGEKHKLEIDEMYLEAGFGELLNLYIGLKTLPWWKKIFINKFKTKFAIEDIESVLNESKYQFPKYKLKWIDNLEEYLKGKRWQYANKGNISMGEIEPSRACNSSVGFK